MFDLTFKILLIEDNEAHLSQARDMLSTAESFYSNITTATSLSEARDCLSKAAFDVILLDLTLPDCDGIASFEKISEYAPSVAAIIMSAHDNKDDAMLTVQKGAQDYLVKGRFDKYLLEKSIRYAIERQKAQYQAKSLAQDWQSTFDAIADPVSIQGIDYKIVRANKAFVDVCGLSREEVIGKTCYEVVHGTHEPWPCCPHRQALETGKTVVEEFFEPRLSRYLRVSASPILSDSNEMVGSIHIVKDITKQESEQRERKELMQQLEGRVKDLDCLYALANLIGRINITLEDIFLEALGIIPGGWQFSDILCVRIRCFDTEHKSDNFQETSWRQTADIVVNQEKVGIIEVYYLEERPEADEGPFLWQERTLLNAIAKHLSGVVERVQAGKELVKSKERYKGLVVNIPGIIYRCVNDPQWTMQYISEGVKAISGYPWTDFVKSKVRSYGNIIHVDDREFVDRMVQEGVSRKEAYEINYRIVHKDGGIRWVHERGRGVFDDRGELLWRDGAIFDMTIQKQLEEVREKFEFIVNTSKDFMSFVNSDYVYEAVNEAYCAAHQRDKEEILGMNLADVWGGEVFSEVIKPHLEVCFPGEDVHYEEWFEFPALGRRYFEVEYYPYMTEDEKVTHVVVVSRDITERKQAENELKRKIEQLEKFHKIAVGRELKMRTLKEQIQALKEQGRNGQGTD